MASQVNYYDVLGVSRRASREEIRAAYRNLAKERHPDHPSGSAEAFSLLQEANNTLSDPNRRKAYDQELDLAFAADQLSDLDFGSLDDELAAKRRERDEESSSGPGLGERLRGRFSRKDREDAPPRGGRDSGRNSGRGRRDDRGGSGGRGRRESTRYDVPQGRWYEPQDFDPEPITFKTGAISFVAAFLAFIVVGQVGLWATGRADPGALAWLTNLAPFMFILYTAVGLGAAYFSYRSAGYWAVALVFVAALIVGGRGGPESLLQFATVGIGLFLLVIYLGNRRDQAARR